MSLSDHVQPLEYDSQIVAFYSYKGGVGRTMALCNVASRIAWLHAKHISQAKTGTQRKTASACRILCVDLDLEAPGVPAFFPPPPGAKVKGFLGLLHEYFENEAQWTEGEGIRDRLRKALGDEFADYAYAVPKTENLFVLPSGHVSVSEAARVRRELHDRLAALREADFESQVNQYVPFFSELKQVLRELFDYAFVDARTGLSDTAYATTIALADSMVFLFRPNVTQLMGIQDVFGRFLRQRDLSLDRNTRIPAIPVLSPRPSYSTPRLKEVREVAAKRVFRWLDVDAKSSHPSEFDPYAPELPKLLELPFDSSMEVGERLMIPPSPDAEPEDTQAPLYKGYVKLALEIQKHNAKRDVLGARFLEQQHWQGSQKVAALNCLLASIAREPDDIKMWEDIGEGYSDQLSTSTPAQNQVLAFCGEARTFPPDRPVPRFFGALWQSEIYEKLAPSLCRPLIGELWQIGASVLDAEMLKYSLTRMSRWYGAHSDEEPPPNCPPWRDVVAADFLSWLASELDSGRLLRVLAKYELYYDSEPSRPEDTVQLYTDELMLADTGHNRAIILSDLAKTHTRRADFRAAFSAYAAAAQLPDCPSSSKGNFIALQMLLLPPERVEAAIRTLLTPQVQPRWLMLLEIRKFSDIDTVRERIEQLRVFASAIAEDPNFEFYSLMHHRRFQEAAEIMGERLGKVKGGVGISDLTKLRLAQWLDSRAEFDAEMSGYARAAIASPKLVFDKPDNDVCLSLAACPEATAREARQRLQQSQWPTARFGWSLVACLCDADVDSLLPEVRQALEGNPLLAPWFRKHEDWPLFRFELERHRELGNIDDASFQRRIEVIDLIESVEADFGSRPDPMPLPEPITSSDDPRFSEIVERWKRNLAWIRDDGTMGPVVDKLVEHVSQRDNKGGSD